MKTIVKEITKHRDEISRARRDLKWARRENILGLSYFIRRCKEDIEARQSIIKQLEQYNDEFEQYG